MCLDMLVDKGFHRWQVEITRFEGINYNKLIVWRYEVDLSIFQGNCVYFDRIFTIIKYNAYIIVFAFSSYYSKN